MLVLALFLGQVGSCFLFQARGHRVHRELPGGVRELDLAVEWLAPVEGLVAEGGFLEGGAVPAGTASAGHHRRADRLAGATRALRPRPGFVPALHHPAPRPAPAPRRLVHRERRRDAPAVIVVRDAATRAELASFLEVRPLPDDLGEEPASVEVGPGTRLLAWYAPWSRGHEMPLLSEVPLRAVDLHTGRVVFEDLQAGAYRMQMPQFVPDPYLLEDTNHWFEHYAGGSRSEPRRMVPGLHRAFSPDGRLLAVGPLDRGLRLYEVATGRRVAEVRLPEGGDWMQELYFDGPYGRLVVSGRGFGALEVGLEGLEVPGGA